MNTGAFGENFPYSNFHDLNMDWIVKIAKDFLDQYTHIQEVIQDGLDSLDEKTQESLDNLQTRYEELETLLNQWYNTHSQDIANELAQAIVALGNAQTSAVNEINSEADAKLAQVLASIPSDYTTLAHRVDSLESDALADRVIVSNNILDSRSGENLLPAEMNGKIFYFGPGIDFNDTYRRQIKYHMHIEKEGGNLGSIANRWVYADGSISSAVNVNYDTDIIVNRSDLVGIQMVCYDTATPTTIKYIGMYAHVENTPTPTYDKYAESISNWNEHITPISTMFNDFTTEDTENYTHTGLVTTALTITGASYPQYYKYWDIPVTEGEFYAIKGTWYASGFKPFLLCKGDRVVYFPSGAEPSVDSEYINVIQIPRGTDRLIVNNAVQDRVGVCGKITGLKTNYWKGKKIVWFGTSIPAGKNSNAESYPIQIGEALGAKVYNEAVSSSCMRAGSYQHSTDIDPMGWGGMNAYSLFLSLSLSSDEKQQIINEWASKWINIITIGADQLTFTEEWIEVYKNASWDRKLAKYLSGGSVGQCDLYVIDHGYNDMVANYGASDLPNEPTEYSDRRYFIGATDFIIRKILDDNPKAKIVIIGHYNNGVDAFGRGANFSSTYVCEAQTRVASDWGMPIVKTWELLGLTMKKIDNDTTPVIYERYPDHLHPNSDTTGAELIRYAEALTPYIRNVR